METVYSKIKIFYLKVIYQILNLLMLPLKIASDSLAIALNKTYNLPITIARPFNTFGPRQSLRAIIPTLITQMMRNDERPVLKLGNINTKRDLVFIDDTVSAIKKFFLTKNQSEIYITFPMVNLTL